MKLFARAFEKPTLLVIAGGESRRMGTSKALLPVPPDGRPLVRHAVERLLPLAANVIVVANDARICAALRQLGEICPDMRIDKSVERMRVNCLPDDDPGHGPLAGLATGLRRIDGWALTVAADMPFVSHAFCSHLIGLADSDHDTIVPIAGGLAHPLHALYHRRCLPAVEKALAAGLRRMDSFWPNARVRKVDAVTVRHLDPDLRTFVNVNTPTEWEEARALLSLD